MKTRYLVLGLLMSLALGVSAREFVKDEQVFVNVNQDFNWGTANAKLFLYFYQTWDNDTYWLELHQVNGNFYAATWDKDVVFDRAIIVRKEPSGTSGNWNNRWNQTCSFDIPNDYKNLNCINRFWDKGNDLNKDCEGSAEWKTYSPATTNVPSVNALKSSGVTQEEIHVCPSSVGEPYSLKVKLNSSKTAYEHDKVVAHAWYYSTNGTSWTCLGSNYAGVVRDQEFNKDTLISLTSSITNGIYYYLYSNIPAGRRLIHIKADATKCALDCEITSFETANSAVNADNNTFTLDGMVAFGQASGNLIIECDDNSGTIKRIPIPNPKSPQSFSLPGVTAAQTNGVKYQAKAYFDGAASGCSKTIMIDVPNAKEEIKEKNIDVLTKKTITLEPENCDADNDFVWIINGVEYWKADGAQQHWTIPNNLIPGDIIIDSTFTCIYKEYLPAPGTMEDLMTNGNYEATSGYGDYGATSTISDYVFWGMRTDDDPINFYENEPSGVNPQKLKDNGFAIVKNAHNFAPSYAKVSAREGSQFALFDAATGASGGNKKAWYAKTLNNQNLKLKKGTTYVLSFWAANINNYGEMDNAARFKFRIEYNNKTWWSRELNLADDEFRNNIWHQCSQTFFAEEDCENVTISVVNLNTNELNIGNDFALDDIQFHAISSVSKVVKSQQQFNVTVHEPKVTAFTATTLPLKCDEGPAYKVAVEVKYKNPNSKLVIEDSDPNVGNRHEYSLPNIAFETEGTLKDTITVTTDDHFYSWHAYFKDWTSAEATATTPRAGVPRIDTAQVSFKQPDCNELTTTLSFNLDYRYQQGTLEYWVDDLTKKSLSENGYSARDTAWKTLPLTFAGIKADGRSDHKLHIKFGGPNSCEKEYVLPKVPLSPVINKVEIVSTIPDKVTCSTTNYPIDVKVTLPYDATGEKLVLFYDENGATKESAEFTVNGKVATTTIVVANIENGNHTIEAAFANRKECKKAIETAYKSPDIARIHDFTVTPSALACDKEVYSISGTITFDLPDGDLIVKYDDAHQVTITNATSPATFTIPNMTAIGDPLTVQAWLSGSPNDECKKTSESFASPGRPHIEVKNLSFSTPDCENATTTLTFDLDYRYQQGQLLINGVQQSVSFNEADTNMLTLTGLKLENIPADGKNDHHLQVVFNGANSCDLDSVLQGVPFSPIINSVTVTNVPQKVLCGEDEYKVSVTVVTPYDATGRNIVLTYEGRDTTIVATGTSTTVQVRLTTIGGAQETITAEYEVTPTQIACPKESVSFATPTRVSCVHDEDAICEGEDYTWTRHDIVYPRPALGIDTFTVGYDSLFLTVYAKPRIQIATVEMACDSEDEIRIPFTKLGGDPNDFIISINGTDYPGTPDGTDIVFDRTNLPAGDYSAIVTVGEANVPCATTENVSFTIALSDQMYSKWTDVLFINNRDGRYTSYLWYEEGKGVITEVEASKQYLYNPAGLPGVYYCRMTTTDNQTVYTCPQRFDEVTPSRTVAPQQQAVKATTIYDTMGRTMHVTPQKGIYIVFEELENGETRARKIAVYE